MTEQQVANARPWPAWHGRGVHILMLLIVCAVVYFPGLDRHGVTNWQEAQRLIVAREMQDRLHAPGGSTLDALLIPTANGRPYLAKPPMIYWAQIGVAEALGERIELFHLRLVVALAATAGVLATYFAAIIVLRPDRTWLGVGGVVVDDGWRGRAALWSALCLATGTLYVRSGRIGELDILLVPFCAIAIGATAYAWRRHRLLRDTNFAAVAVAVIAAACAVMVKDPGAMVIGLAAFGGIGLWAACAPSGTPMDVALIRGRGRAPLVPLPARNIVQTRVEIGLGLAGALAALLAAGRNVRESGDLPGVFLIATFGGIIGRLIARLAQPVRCRVFVVALSRTHPVLVLGGAVVIRVLWGAWVADRIGTAAAGSLVQQEVEDNVRLLIPEAPLNNLEAMAFGVGIGSLAMIAGLLWWVRDRAHVPAAWFQLIAWLLFGLIAFSVLGKGVQRYLTPLWPAVAIVGGAAIATLLGTRSPERRKVVAGALGVLVVMLAVGQGWWYAYGREARFAQRSPRDLIAELRRTRWVDVDRLVSFEFAHPALDYYAERHVQPVGDPRVNASMAGGDAWTIERLRIAVAKKRSAFVLARAGRITGDTSNDGGAEAPAVERLRDAGFQVDAVDHKARFEIDSGRSEVRCYRVRLAAE